MRKVVEEGYWRMSYRVFWWGEKFCGEVGSRGGCKERGFFFSVLGIVFERKGVGISERC